MAGGMRKNSNKILIEYRTMVKFKGNTFVPMRILVCIRFALLCSVFFWLAGTAAHSQTDSIPPDTGAVKLPFHIDSSKRMEEEELKNKKEGTFVTGLPRFEFDPIRGFGLGGDVFLLINGKKDDPFFEYTPYRHRVGATFFIFENGRIRYAINYDAPYIFNTKWRLRADAVFWEDPEAQYWGVGAHNLRQPLRFRNKRTGQMSDFYRIAGYEDNLALAEQGADGEYYTDVNFHHISQREQLYNLLAERTFYGGRLRFMFGYEMLFTSFSTYGGVGGETVKNLEGEEVEAINNKTLVEIEREAGVWDRYNLGGLRNDDRYYFTSMLAAALIYDTRDFEPDASKGLFLQYSHEYSAPWLGSNFNFHKFMVQAQYFKTLYKWRNKRNRITFAGMASFGYIFGPNINFIEMWDLSSQAEAGGILVMGGARSLRGFREARFLAPAAGLVNLELRSRFFDFKVLRQHIAFGLTPFLDFGSVWDSPWLFTFANWKSSAGMGVRMAWNQSTILRLDFAGSSEGTQTFFGFGHIF